MPKSTGAAAPRCGSAPDRFWDLQWPLRRSEPEAAMSIREAGAQLPSASPASAWRESTLGRALGHRRHVTRARVRCCLSRVAVVVARPGNQQEGMRVTVRQSVADASDLARLVDELGLGQYRARDPGGIRVFRSTMGPPFSQGKGGCGPSTSHGMKI